MWRSDCVSFKVDHTKLEPGFYISRVDGGVTTWDLRIFKPNCDMYLTTTQMHTLEHLLAYTLRSKEYNSFYKKIIYVGPMGCRTGFYILTVNMNPKEVKDMLISCLSVIPTIEVVPGSDAKSCGNYKDLSISSIHGLPEYILSHCFEKGGCYEVCS